MSTPFIHTAFLLAALSLGLSGCSKHDPETDAVLAKINNYNLTLDEYQYQLNQELELDSDFKVTPEAQKEFLEELIRKELLIQEAKKLKLDTKEEFVQTIQRYWESTLIRNLLDVKGRDISSKIYVSEDAIETRYQKLARLDGSLGPIRQVRAQIVKELEEEKKTEMMEAWMTDLRKKASVQIEDDLLTD